MDRRPKKSRPSNVITYVFLSLMALIGLFVLGQLLQSLGRENTDQSDRGASVVAALNSTVQ